MFWLTVVMVHASFPGPAHFGKADAGRQRDIGPFTEETRIWPANWEQQNEGAGRFFAIGFSGHSVHAPFGCRLHGQMPANPDVHGHLLRVRPLSAPNSPTPLLITYRGGTESVGTLFSAAAECLDLSVSGHGHLQIFILGGRGLTWNTRSLTAVSHGLTGDPAGQGMNQSAQERSVDGPGEAR